MPDSQARAAMDEQIAIYVNGAGACERLLRTCIPMCYTRHLSRARTAHHRRSDSSSVLQLVMNAWHPTNVLHMPPLREGLAPA